MQLVTFQRHPLNGEVKMLALPDALRGGADAALTTVDLAYRYVPWFRRACKLRAGAVGRFPLSLENDAGDDLSEEPAYQAVMLWTRAMLYRIEMNLIKHGAAYHLLEINRFGLNHTPRFIPSNSVLPRIDYASAGVIGFHIAWHGGGGEYPLDRVVWVWEPNDESEIEPGPSDGQAALKAAGLLYAIDEMANRYMGGGGVPVTAVRVPPTVDKDERIKVETWLARFMGGFRNAFKFLVIDKQTEFEKLGSEMKDIQAPELTATQRDNVAVALGVPPTVLDGKSANYATANSEMTGFYMNTVIPQVEMLEPVLNVQLYQRLGLTLRFRPDELEVMQAIQLDQARGVTELVGKPVLSVNEGRAIIEYDELPAGLGAWSTPEAPPAPSGSPAQRADPDELEPESMRALLKRSLDLFRAGSPVMVGAAFDAELAAASSGRMIRNIFEQRWPRPKASWQERAVDELARYNTLVVRE